ncbi:cardiolipin synthase [Parablautia sp. Marseille-Q6255]|uniref:cardiolipin synthase n=1 Tax=Parablautia sp. Marseille-Q6255 TaxID=3039593 RepID=UPI0024BC271E|nr:cardiolipin synthase [Parablautia sp. Marseille-Q6255]
MKLIFLAIYIFLILAVIFLERKRPTEALLWVLVMVCIPYAGVFLYLIFGNTVGIRLTSFLRKRRLKFCASPLETNTIPIIPEECLSAEDAQVICFNNVYNHSELTSYETASFYTNGRSHYEQLFKDIAQAKTCIFVEFYTIHHDEVGTAFVNALTQKAAEGVEVLVLFDFIANLSSPASMFRPLKEVGGKVIRVKPYLTHYRSHRKIVTIDHYISYIGGMNIGKQYANLAKVKNPWRDTQIRLTGTCTHILDEYFLTDWLCSIRQKHCADTVAHIIPMLGNREKITKNFCQFIIGGADTTKESVKMCYLSMIRSARSSIRIQTPYFIPDASILDALKTAAAAGVKIELMIPGIKASFFLDPVTTFYCGQLMQYGASVYKYHGYIHAKTMVIDEELCCIGSVNMDMRSLLVDDEICGVFYTNELVKQYIHLFQKDINDCTSYTLEQFQNRGQKEKLMESVFLLLAPIL